MPNEEHGKKKFVMNLDKWEKAEPLSLLGVIVIYSIWCSVGAGVSNFLLDRQLFQFASRVGENNRFSLCFLSPENNVAWLKNFATISPFHVGMWKKPYEDSPPMHAEIAPFPHIHFFFGGKNSGNFLNCYFTPAREKKMAGKWFNLPRNLLQ